MSNVDGSSVTSDVGGDGDSLDAPSSVDIEAEPDELEVIALVGDVLAIETASSMR